MRNDLTENQIKKSQFASKKRSPQILYDWKRVKYSLPEEMSYKKRAEKIKLPLWREF